MFIEITKVLKLFLSSYVLCVFTQPLPPFRVLATLVYFVYLIVESTIGIYR
jgi:hypothetical protein